MQYNVNVLHLMQYKLNQMQYNVKRHEVCSVDNLQSSIRPSIYIYLSIYLSINYVYMRFQWSADENESVEIYQTRIVTACWV